MDVAILYTRTLKDGGEKDDVYEESEVFENYVPTTIDPGQSLFIIAIIVCVCSLLFLPLTVHLCRKLQKKYDCGSDADVVFDDTKNPAQQYQRFSASAMQFALEKGLRRLRKRAGQAVVFCTSRKMITTSRAVEREKEKSASRLEKGDALLLSDDDISLSESDVELAMDDDDIQDDEMQVSSYQPPKKNLDVVEESFQEDITKPTKPRKKICSSKYLRKKLLFIWTIIKFDTETRRLLQLAIPFSLSALTSSISNVITVALISEVMGTDSMVAVIVVEIVVGISSSFASGWVEAISSVGSMAYGAENYELLGQYVKTSCIIYTLIEIPMGYVWSTQIENIVLLMGFDDVAAKLAHTYVWVYVANNIVSGLNEIFLDLLEVAEHEIYANAMSCISSIIDVFIVAFFTIVMETSLVTLGLVMLANQILFLLLNTIIPYYLGWLWDFKLCTCKCLSFDGFKVLFKTAIPLSFGSLLAYAEWEIFIVFAAVLGPAEAASWGILGYVWSVFESATGAICDASEVRCAYQMGKGKPVLAKFSAYKSMLMAVITSTLVSSIFVCLSSTLLSWLSNDATIKSMISKSLPLIALGNVTMNMGMVSWALLGAQGRYRLATSIATACSLLITIPVGAILTIRFNINLEGLTFAVVVGYSITAMLLTTVLLTSDWEKRSKKIHGSMVSEAS